MATPIAFRRLPLIAPYLDRTGLLTLFRSLALLFGLFFSSIPAYAQLQQPFVFAADSANPKNINVYTRNDLTGVLTPVTGSPFPSRQDVNVITLDFKGRFLFTASNTGSTPGEISMFTIDPNTGALQEVPNSPFASPATNVPVFLSTESSAQFLYVINYISSAPNTSTVESFQIDAVNLGLIPSSKGATPLPGLFLTGATHPSGKTFYAFLNVPNGAIPNQAVFLVFNSSTGIFTAPTLPGSSSSIGIPGCCLALDSPGQKLALGISTSLLVYTLNSDGTLPSGSGGNSGAFNGPANSMSFDTLGQFLYADLSNPGSTPPDRVHFYLASTALESANSPLPLAFPVPGLWNVDPTAPLIYADQVYKVDPQTGLPSSLLPASPLSPPSATIPRALFSLAPGSQPIVGPIALLSATSFSFGSLSVGQPSSAQTLLITSNGGQALSLNTLAITGANPGDFTETDTCHVPTALQPGQSCSVLITFTPTATGSRTAALTITDNASPAIESAQLNGTGLAPAPAVTLIPGTLNFGNVAQGTSASLNISVTNSGTAALHITSVALGGTNANDYASSSPTCGSAIAVNSSCTISVTFAPLAAGLRSAAISISDDAPGSPQTVALSGSGVSFAPAVTLLPTSLDFGTVTQGTSTSLNFSVKNSGSATLHITSIILGGTNAADFTSSSPTCSSPVAVNSACTVIVTFTPLASGPLSANVSITDDASGSPQTLNLTGAGVVPVPAITLSPAAPSFQTTTQGTSGAAQTLTVSNPGTGPLHISSVSLSGPNPSDFSFINNCSAPVAPAASCAISMVFSPLGSGQRAASLLITDDAAGSPQTVSLSAMANLAFVVGTAPGGSTSASVSAGQTAQFLLQFTPGAGYSGTVSLACSGAPLGAVCQIPASIAITSGAPAPLTVAVTTSGSAMLPPSIPGRLVPPAGIRLLLLLAFALIFVGAIKNRWILQDAVSGGNRSKFVGAPSVRCLAWSAAVAQSARRLACGGALAAIFLYAVIYAAGCGSGSATVTPAPTVTPPAIVTPSGTSMITITLAATSSLGQPLQLQPIQLTLTVK